MGVGLFSQQQTTGQEEMALICTRICFGWILGEKKNKITERVVRCWNRLSREVDETPSLEVSKRRIDVVFRDAV